MLIARPLKQLETGSSLVELMISVFISLIVLSGIITITVISTQRSRENIQIMRLNQELRAVLDIMANEIRRAGYWANAQNDVSQNTNTNPFMAVGTDLTIPNANCILFTYDRDNNGTLATINTGSDDERYGFRLNGGAVQGRLVTASFDCASGAGTWQDLTDPNAVTVSNLQFTTVPAAGFQVINLGGTSTLTVREVKITITGNLAGNAAITRTLTTSVRVQNDKFSP